MYLGRWGKDGCACTRPLGTPPSGTTHSCQPLTATTRLPRSPTHIQCVTFSSKFAGLPDTLFTCDLQNSIDFSGTVFSIEWVALGCVALFRRLGPTACCRFPRFWSPYPGQGPPMWNFGGLGGGRAAARKRHLDGTATASHRWSNAHRNTSAGAVHEGVLGRPPDSFGNKHP